MGMLSYEEALDLLRQQIKDFEAEAKMEEVGVVYYVGDGVARAYGLENVMAMEVVEFEGGEKGLAFNLEEDNVGIIILGSETGIREGSIVRRTNQILSTPVGEGLVGRVINPLGEPLDGKGPVEYEYMSPVEKIAPGVVARKPVHEPLQTGIKAIDSMIPIGRGQRELIIGDRATGKTTICIDTILNQRDTDVYCIYVAIGQKRSTTARIIELLEKEGAMEYTTVVVASATDPASLQYLAPFVGCTIGEYFRDNGKHALVVYDDLSKHAEAYRQLSLLMRRPPGREAYPGDVFYLHSRLLERAAKLNDDLGAGSLTALPIIETKAGDVAAYIPTNVISITDGQIYLEPDLFNKGVRPAINVGLSVSRVGGAAQIKAMKQVAGTLRLDLAQFRELEAFVQFASELDKATQQTINRGMRLVELLKQEPYNPLPVEKQIVAIFAGTNGYLDDLPVESVRKFEKELYAFLDNERPDVLQEIKEKKALDDELKQKIKEALDAFKERFVP
ncbi:F0F1 ATP synthase subunit alpha [Hydrogenivirga sp. 128-5-R1-1]|uniref:F0F1 ATP synthase subunit alpha n=1 Tax=Hydrogenivirga sp. 128-5-R1-1 TaxID=392423 RepID=UPI00015F1809|nr:F0F1 ATP synthase subunit alpha [Hydrogenivirga sp. 128-5-R1-1]EDP76186.1 ATP synthase subunit A [Hydrogenivirga sp. 128-5-R1-1]